MLYINAYFPFAAFSIVDGLHISRQIALNHIYYKIILLDIIGIRIQINFYWKSLVFYFSARKKYKYYLSRGCRRHIYCSPDSF